MIPEPVICPRALLMGAEEEVVESGEGFPKAAPRARVTYWGNVSYQHPDPAREPTTVEIRHSQEVESLEQVYVRHLVADLSWRKVDTGWVEDVSLLVIKNTTPPNGHKDDLLVCFGEPHPTGDVLLPPGKALVLRPCHKKVHVAALLTDTTYSVTAVPK